MTIFDYSNGVLRAESVPLPEIAQKVDTPFYCYSAQRLRDNYESFSSAFNELNATIYYAIKANGNQATIRTLAACGAGADIVSVGELMRALEAGIPPGKIVFSSAGKTEDEIKAALIAHIYQLNVESMPELKLISQIATETGTTAPIALRINPDVNAGTHEKISTGHKETKFGIEISQLYEAMNLATTLPGVSFKGFTMHIGSHINDYAPFREAYSRLRELVEDWRARGVKIERLDLGGGVAIPYDKDDETTPFSEYAKIVRETVGDLGCHLSFEPGRRLVGDAGILVSRVLYVKDTPSKRFVIIDAAMNDLVRPAMYGARHSIIPVEFNKSGETTLATVAGAVCETSDSFGDDFALPTTIKAGDLIAILQAGAYGSAMSSTYNARPLIPEVIVLKEVFAQTRRRISVAEQISWDSIPKWL
ncbi:MAG: diaminopimelate decarboxylase [Alphaproteobacteria bacterium]|nr:diaminopimelate decarboxylase [Alphaproteobacteria bacterium]